MAINDGTYIALDALGIPALLVGADDVVRHANAAAVDLLGEPEGRRLGELLPIGADERTIRLGSRVFQMNEGAPEHTAPQTRLVVLTEVTVLAAARQTAEREARARSDFMGKLSHEVRSALASMIGFAELLHDELSESNRELARIITLSGRHLIDTLNGVIDLSRIEFDDEQLELTSVNVAGRARDRVAVLRSSAERKGLDLVFRAGTEPITARLNPIFFDRILHNLIENAVKYTDEGRVEVDVEARDGQVWIYVADTGRGVERAFLPKLFAPFERERQRDDGGDGSGLGLAVTRYLVELMDGRITVCSTPGEGSTFTVTFPGA